jgi:hypothetical protein
MFKQILNRPRTADLSIGYGNTNYNRGLISDVIGYAKQDIDPLVRVASEQAAREKLVYRRPSYGISSSRELIEGQLPHTDVFIGDAASPIIGLGGDTARGVSGSYGAGLVTSSTGNPFFVAVRDEVNDLKGLRTLAHEASHVQLGHSNSGGYDLPVPLPIRRTSNINQIEAEAEMAAAEVLNRLGYGYTPGLAKASGTYASGYYPKLNKEAQRQVVLNSREAAEQLVPDKIRRFGPLSRKEDQQYLDNPFVASQAPQQTTPPRVAKMIEDPKQSPPVDEWNEWDEIMADVPEVVAHPTNNSARGATINPSIIADRMAEKINPYYLVGGVGAAGLGSYLLLNSQPQQQIVSNDPNLLL